MRIPNAVQQAHQWQIHSLVTDFTLEDVWALPDVAGGKDDFNDVVALAAGFDPAHADSLPTRFVWGARDRLGRLFDLGEISTAALDDAGPPIPGAGIDSLRDRVPADLRDTASGVHFQHLPFVPLYRTQNEFAAELSNPTVHGVMHLSWVPQGSDNYHAQMAVYVKPRGWFGRAYMAFIKPFRYVVVYPALERQFGRAFTSRRANL
ncbi:DUF2867 domain-containing protein [Mycolicibacterium sp. CBMA 226]|uniref:DUF2867 domain-containing protein n=1 Tax=Mycolicibacterium sp. CBMA 226 TaxID=2606611 RepID=UPI0012DCF913|nr:DUF2867 domain-containing protein [Mycolicibacterium sp. CBMA 226]MUL78813.1 DUF2867 domain-containing protein [Mycolicibacterium sp. CBMA 226]QGW61108.1 hypothetical protein ICEMyc226_00076 [Mycolicibacterium sp.]